MHTATAIQELRPDNAVLNPGSEFVLRFLRETGHPLVVPEAIVSGLIQDSVNDRETAYATLKSLSVSERDALFHLIDRVDQRLAGRGGLFALDALQGLLMQMELEAVEVGGTA